MRPGYVRRGPSWQSPRTIQRAEFEPTRDRDGMGDRRRSTVVLGALRILAPFGAVGFFGLPLPDLLDNGKSFPVCQHQRFGAIRRFHAPFAGLFLRLDRDLALGRLSVADGGELGERELVGDSGNSTLLEALLQRPIVLGLPICESP